MADECLEMALHCRVKNKYRHSILHGAITWRFVVFPATEKSAINFTMVPRFLQPARQICYSDVFLPVVSIQASNFFLKKIFGTRDLQTFFLRKKYECIRD